MRKHYVEFLSPGSFVSESTTKSIDFWDTRKAIEISTGIKERHNATPYGFRFITKIEHPPVPDGEGGMLNVLPKVVEESGIYYLGGTVEKYDDVLNRNDDKESILRSNMRCNRWWLVVVNTNSFRSCMPFNEKDFVVDDRGYTFRSGADADLMLYCSRKNAMADKASDERDWDNDLAG